MSKKCFQGLFITVMSLLPLSQGVAVVRHEHLHQSSSQLKTVSVRNLMISGKIVNGETIQVSSDDIAKPGQLDAIRIITLLDADNVKQRYVLLPSRSSQFLTELQKFRGHIKEFRLYSVVNEQNQDIQLLASKRVMAAPANQITFVFDSVADAKNFFTGARKEILLQAGFRPAVRQKISTDISQEQAIEVPYSDEKKVNIIEPVALFPTRSMVVAGAILTVKDGDLVPGVGLAAVITRREEPR